MSRHPPWLPNATALVVGGFGVEINAAAWARLEALLQQALDTASRRRLLDIGNLYLGLRTVELDPPLVSDARARIDEIQEAAAKLCLSLRSLSDSDAGHHVAQVFGYVLRDIRTAKGDNTVVLGLEQMELAAEILSEAASGVWERLKPTRRTPKPPAQKE